MACLQELLILLCIILHVAQDFDRDVLPAVHALIQIPKRAGRYLFLEYYVRWIQLPIIAAAG